MSYFVPISRPGNQMDFIQFLLLDHCVSEPYYFQKRKKLKLNEGLYLAISQTMWFKTWTLSWQIPPLAVSKQTSQEACGEEPSSVGWDQQTPRTVMCSGTPKDDRFILNFPWGEILLFPILMLLIYLWKFEAGSTASKGLLIYNFHFWPSLLFSIQSNLSTFINFKQNLY